MSDRGQNPITQVVRYVSLAMMLPFGGLAGYIIGYYLDKAFGTHFLSIVVLILGTVGGFIQLIRGLGRE